MVHAYSEACLELFDCLFWSFSLSLAHSMHMIASPHPGYQTALPVAQLGSVRRAEITAAKSGPWPLQSIRNGVSKRFIGFIGDKMEKVGNPGKLDFSATSRHLRGQIRLVQVEVNARVEHIVFSPHMFQYVKIQASCSGPSKFKHLHSKQSCLHFVSLTFKVQVISPFQPGASTALVALVF